MPNKVFSKRIRQIRLNNKLTMNNFAKLFDLKKSRINMWENNGVIPRIEVLIKIANHYNVSTDYLLGNDKMEE